MKSTSPQLAAFFASAQQVVKADLYTITLSGGTVLRYTDADGLQLDTLGNQFLPLDIRRSALRLVRGVEVDTLTLTLHPQSTDLINGQPLLAFAVGGGFDGAQLLLETAYKADASAPLQGTLVRFGGTLGAVKNAGRSQVEIDCNSALELLNQQMPRNVYGAACLHTLFDVGCGLNRAAFTASGTAQAGSTASVILTSATAASGLYTLGTLTFTSGANAGVKRTVKADANGSVTVLPELPFAPQAGDAYQLTQGCDRAMSTCGSKFSNLARFRGFPFIPPPETSV